MTITAKVLADSTSIENRHKNTVIPLVLAKTINSENSLLFGTSPAYGYFHKGHENNPYPWINEHARLITLQLRYPRFIHSELMTHRVFSRNASSSRAIPVERLIQDVIDDTAMPIHWGKNQPGMQAREEHDATVMIEIKDGYQHYTNKGAWIEARDRAIDIARAYAKSNYHKQLVNRLLEPFSHINVVVTSNQWSNFMELRYHEDAQPEIRELAGQILNAINTSQPKLLKIGEWHLPYIETQDRVDMFDRMKNTYDSDLHYDLNFGLAKISTARCARTSYLTHDGKPTEFDKDMKLFDDLMNSKPLHASPAEHQAMLVNNKSELKVFKSNFNMGTHLGNEKNDTPQYIQFRKIIEYDQLLNNQILADQKSLLK